MDYNILLKEFEAGASREDIYEDFARSVARAEEEYRKKSKHTALLAQAASLVNEAYNINYYTAEMMDKLLNPAGSSMKVAKNSLEDSKTYRANCVAVNCESEEYDFAKKCSDDYKIANFLGKFNLT